MLWQPGLQLSDLQTQGQQSLSVPIQDLPWVRAEATNGLKNLVYCSWGGNTSQYSGFLFWDPFKDSIYTVKLASWNPEKPASRSGILVFVVFLYEGKKRRGQGEKGKWNSLMVYFGLSALQGHIKGVAEGPDSKHGTRQTWDLGRCPHLPKPQFTHW